MKRLAELLVYPNGLRPSPDDSPEVREFFAEVAHVSQDGMEELYTTTFDLNPVATLEVGWHLWGEQYERGRFLADLRALQEAIGVDAGTELPDHLTVVLRTMAHMNDPSDLAEKIAPAIEKILKPLEEQGNPYRHLIAAVKAALSVPSPRLRGEGQGEGLTPSSGLRPPSPPRGGEGTATGASR